MTGPLPLVVDPALVPAWEGLGLADARLQGLAVAVVAGRGACVVVTDRGLTDAEIGALGGRVADLVEVPAMEVAALAGDRTEDLLRQWVNQAAQGSGRGVGVRVEASGDGVRILVRAIDSSARELELRLSSPHEPALAALRAACGGLNITVRDAET